MGELHLVIETEDDPAHLAAIRELHDLSVGRVVVEVMPSNPDSAAWIVWDVASALGKSEEDLQGANRTAGQQLSWLAAWLGAEEVSDLILVRGERAQQPAVDQLKALWQSIEANVWVIAMGGVHSRAMSRLGSAPGVRTWEWSEFADWAGSRPPKPQSSATAGRPHVFPVVPDDNLPTFIASCEASLCQPDFERVAKQFDRGRRHVLAEGGSVAMTAERAADLCRSVVDTADSADHALALLRGCQVGFFWLGHALRVNPRMLRAVFAAAPALRSDDAADVARRHLSPSRAAQVVFAALRLSPREMTELTLSSLTADCSAVTTRGRSVSVPDSLQVPLRALKHHRIAQAAGNADPLLVDCPAQSNPQGPGRQTPELLKRQLEHSHGLASRSLTRTQEPRFSTGSAWLARNGLHWEAA